MCSATHKKEQSYTLSSIPKAETPQDLLEVFDLFANGVEPDPTIADHRTLFAAYLQSRFVHGSRLEVGKILDSRLRDMFLAGPSPEKRIFGRARATVAIEKYPVTLALRTYTDNLIRKAGQSRSNLFEIEANFGFWRKVLGLTKPPEFRDKAEVEQQRLLDMRQLDRLVTQKQREKIRDTRIPAEKRAILVYNALSKVLKKKSASPDFIHAAMKDLAGVIGFFDPAIVAKLKSDDGMERVQGIQDLLSRRDGFAMELGFESHASEMFDRYPSKDSIFLKDNSAVETEVATFLAELKTLRPELKYSSSSTVRQLSLSESPMRACLAASDCSTNTYFSFARNPNVVYFTSTDFRGHSEGHVTLALGKAEKNEKLAFVDKIQGVDFDRVEIFLESVRQILAESGYTLVFTKRDLGQNGLSNDTALSQQVMQKIELEPKSLGAFEFPSVSKRTEIGFSRARKKFLVFAMKPAVVMQPNSVELIPTPEPRRLTLASSAEDLLRKTMSLKDGNDDDKLMFLNISTTLTDNNILSKEDLEKVVAEIFQGTNAKLKYLALYQWFRNTVQESTYYNLEPTNRLFMLLTPAELNQFSSQLLQRKDSASIESDLRLLLLRYRPKALSEEVAKIRPDQRLNKVADWSKYPDFGPVREALRQSLTEGAPEGALKMISSGEYPEYFLNDYFNSEADLQSKIDLAKWFLIDQNVFENVGMHVFWRLPNKYLRDVGEALSAASPKFRVKYEWQRDHSCFVAGTRVLIPKGFRSIETVKVGDQVIAYDMEQKKPRVQIVTHLFVHRKRTILKVKFDDGKSIRVTPEHPFYLPLEDLFKPIGQLYAGDQVFSANGEKVRITSIQSVPGRHTVYNFEVSQDHNYFVEGLLVHNPTK